MQDYGLVSIITPTWACADFIAETIKSIQCQTYQNLELLIQDDCSKDNTLEVSLLWRLTIVSSMNVIQRTLGLL